MRKRFCLLFLEEELADAVMKEAVETEYEEEFDKHVSNSERVNRILRRYFTGKQRN